MTKPMTAAAAMILVQRGILDIMAPVSRYLSGFCNQKVAANQGLVPVLRDVTVQDLLGMTSGLVYPGDNSVAEVRMGELFSSVKERQDNGQPVSTIEFANMIGMQPLAFQPGEGWQYGTSADVLGAVIEAASGVALGEFMHHELFDPLGMTDTDFYVPADKTQRFSRLYQMKDGHLVPFLQNHLGLNNFLSKPAFESGGAGLVSTIDDSLRFCRMLLGSGELMGRRILSKAAVHYMTHSQLTRRQMECFQWETLRGFGYSCFMRVMQCPSMSPTFGSEGEFGWDGWTGTYMTVDPAHQMILLVMMQKTDAGTTKLTRKLRNIVYADIVV